MGVVGISALLASCAPNVGVPIDGPGPAPDEDLADNLTTYEAITGYCNFADLTGMYAHPTLVSMADDAPLAKNFWSVCHIVYLYPFRDLCDFVLWAESALALDVN